MSKLSVPALIGKRLADDWKILLGVFVGMFAGATLAAAVPIYLRSLEQLAYTTALEDLSSSVLELQVFAPRLPLDQDSINDAERDLAEAIDRNLSSIHLGREVYIRGNNNLAGFRGWPLPEERGTNAVVARGYLQNLSGLAQRSRFVDGQMAGDAVAQGADGPVLEAVTGVRTAKFFDLEVGDVVTLTPDLGVTPVVSAKIVGVLEPADPEDPFWLKGSILLEPPPIDEAPPQGIRVTYPDPDEPPPPPVALFVTSAALVNAVGPAFPGTLVDPVWYITANVGPLKEWSLSETSRRLDAFESDIVDSIPRASVTTGPIRGLVQNVRKRGFFAALPLALIGILMLATLLLYLWLAVSYLARSRERDAALLRSRGVGILQLTRIYAVEGLGMTVVAAALAPFVAMAIVASAGKAPYFADITGGEWLSLRVGLAPYLASVSFALLCVIILVASTVSGAASGLLAQKLKSARPPALTLLHRYYLDVALIAAGALVFWELQSRGEFLAGGVFKEVEVNETLLLTPVLFLVAVVLVFLRFFPILMRYISGESPTVVHVLAATAVTSMIAVLALRAIQDGGAVLIPAALTLAVGAVYWTTVRLDRTYKRLIGIVVQAVLVAGLMTLEPLAREGTLFGPTVAILALVPAQIGYMLLSRSRRSTPMWLSLGLRHLSRNPLQYTWLVLLLALAAGLGILATTVGGTLQRSQEERVLFEIPTDIRIRGHENIPSLTQTVSERYLDISGIESVALALRTFGSLGPANIQVLGLEPANFLQASWYRDDFSEGPLRNVLGALQSEARPRRLQVPEGATTMGVWVRPDGHARLDLWMVVEQGGGEIRSFSLGEIDGPGWQLISKEIPDDLDYPLHLVAIEIFEQRTRQTPGTLVIDNIHVTMGSSEDTVVLEDFEIELGWTAMLTSAASTDQISATGDDPYAGRWSAMYSFGNEGIRGMRGIYLSPTAGPMPVVISSSLTNGAGFAVGDVLRAKIAGWWLPVVVRGTVDYFPTLGHESGAFMIANLDHLAAGVNILSSAYSSIKPNERYLTVDPTARSSVAETVTDMVDRFALVLDREEVLESVRRDPLASAGWRSMVLLALTVVVVAGVLGYATYSLLYANQSRMEIGFLRSMGLSRLQLMGMLGIEHLAIIAVGLGLGTWAGFQMSRLIVSPLAVDDFGRPVLPPFVLTTDWAMTAVTLAALVTAFLVVLFVLARGMRRLELHTIARIGEE